MDTRQVPSSIEEAMQEAIEELNRQGTLKMGDLSPPTYSQRINLTPPKKHDPVDHPSHYTQGSVECIEAIEAAMTPEEFRGYCKGAALKYIWREKHKGQQESIRKAIWYLQCLVD